MNKYRAYGFVETVGFLAMVASLDAMLKSANVLFSGYQNMNGLFTTCIQGDISSVTHAVKVGVKVAEEIGEVVGSRVISAMINEIEQKLDIVDKELVKHQLSE